mgnify:CR=1 FL=1
MGIIRGICTSDIRGIQKSEVQEADIEVDWGIVGDAHGGKWHRQISCFRWSAFRNFVSEGRMWNLAHSEKILSRKGTILKILRLVRASRLVK